MPNGMPIDLAQELNPIKPEDEKEKYGQLLSNLQGNILKGHGRDHTVHIFIKLNGDAEAKGRFGAVARRIVTSMEKQLRESRQYRDFRIPGSLFGNVFLTAKGYAALGFQQDEVEAALSDHYFREGMSAHAAGQNDLNDPPLKDWDEGYVKKEGDGGYVKGEIDAMILLADDDREFLLRRAREVIIDLEQFSTVLAVERGDALRADNREGIEHFGYVDGRSQPIYFEADFGNEGTRNNWQPDAGLKLVLVQDELVEGAKEKDAFGSYFVFRKLEQDVRRFKICEEQLADALGLKGEERRRAGAMVVGRFPDGTPLKLSKTDGYIPIKENDFTYGKDKDVNGKEEQEGDEKGFRCPFHAHIRKANPRGDTVRLFDRPKEEELSRRITRRGITYGERSRHPNAFQALEDLPTGGVGLLFMCFQASIAGQFAFIQQVWVNNPEFARQKPADDADAERVGTGLDPLIGQGPKSKQHWPKNWGAAETADFCFSDFVKLDGFKGFVTLKGGEYFFAPSIPFLRSLGGNQ